MKSKPTGIRFDTDKLEFAKKATGMDTPQKVVNHLLDKFWWENGGDVLEAQEAPEITEEVGTPHPEPKKAVKAKKTASDEPPEGLKGIDLRIWKEEHQKLNKNTNNE